MFTLEFWITGLLVKKLVISSVQVEDCICQCKLIDLVQPLVLFLQRVVAIVVTGIFIDRNMLFLVLGFTIGEYGVIDKTATSKSLVDLFRLLIIWIDPIFVTFSTCAVEIA